MSDSEYYRILPKTYSKLTNRMIKEIKGLFIYEKSW